MKQTVSQGADKVKRWSIRDVAKVAGVSPATVSRVLNEHPTVSADLKRRVHDAIRTLEGRGASPRRIAVALPQRGEGDDPEPSGWAQLLSAAHQVLREAGHELALLPYSPAEGAEAVVRAQRDRSDAFILICNGASEELAREAQRQGKPTIVVDRRVRGVDSVVADDLGGGEDLTAHVLEQGYRSLAFVSESFADPASAARRRGFEQAVSQSGVQGLRTRHCELGAGWTSAAEVVEELCETLRPPFALVAGSDMTALHLLGIVKARGLSIPGDVGLAGFGDIPQAGRVNPPLTSVRVDRGQMGRLVARRMLDRLASADLTPVTITMHAVVVGRASTALRRTRSQG